jgi:transketolase
MDDLMSLRAIDSSIDGHPNPVLGFPFFDAATGSLGQGLSVSGGLAAAARIDRIDKTIYCADHTLTNVVAIFNCNTLGQSDFVATVEDWQHLQHKAEAGRRSRSTGTIRTPSRIRCAGARSSVPANLCASSRAR